ncbi:MAG: hypothetical protein ACNA8W_26455, partial [Bradymonadaceae bacterium]
VAVLADVSTSARVAECWSDFDFRGLRSEEGLEDALEGLLVEEPSVVVIDGDDRFLSRILTAYLGDLRHCSRPLRLLALGEESLTTVADATSGGLDRKRARRYLRNLAADRWQTSTLASLRITSSAEPSARSGFTFGAGWWYTAFEAYYRSGRADGAGLGKAALRLAQESLEGVASAPAGNDARLTINAVPYTNPWSHLMATTLSRSWFGLEGSQRSEPAMWLGERNAELIRQLMASRSVPYFSDRHWRAVNFERSHLDGLPGYVLDGELHMASHPQVIQVCQGPRVYFMRPETGVVAHVGGLFKRHYQ